MSRNIDLLVRAISASRHSSLAFDGLRLMTWCVTASRPVHFVAQVFSSLLIDAPGDSVQSSNSSGLPSRLQGAALIRVHPPPFEAGRLERQPLAAPGYKAGSRPRIALPAHRGRHMGIAADRGVTDRPAVAQRPPQQRPRRAPAPHRSGGGRAHPRGCSVR